MQSTVYIATSVDGFIARPNGSLDWLPTNDDGEDYGYQQFINSVDALVMGRHTYEKVLSFPAWPYGNRLVIVLSSQLLTVPEHLPNTIEFMLVSPQEVVHRLKERGVQHLYVDGGKTIQGFLRAGLINRLILTRVPILIGSGIPLFGTLPQDMPLRHLQTRSFPSGLVQTEYEVMGSLQNLR